MIRRGIDKFGVILIIFSVLLLCCIASSNSWDGRSVTAASTSAATTTTTSATTGSRVDNIGLSTTGTVTVVSPSLLTYEDHETRQQERQQQLCREKELNQQQNNRPRYRRHHRRCRRHHQRQSQKRRKQRRIWRRISRGGAADTQQHQQQQQQSSSFSEKLVEIRERMKEGRSKILKEFEQRQQTFLDRMAMVGNSLLERESEAELALTSPHDHNLNENAVTPQSDLSRPGRNFTIVTTASLPWFTGTSVNPLLRAAYLTRYTDQINKHDGVRRVTLVIPWLELEEDQQLLYGNHRFKTQQDQEAYIRNWLAEDAGMPDAASPETGLKIIFYPARYHSGMKSIFAMGDIVSLIPDSDVCVLEEPEHLNWYRAPGDGYTYKFNYVIGVVHTNYKEYASSQYHGLWTAPAIAMVSSAMVRAYCHKVIKLSDVLQTFAPHKEETSNTHGVRADFLMEGNRRARAYDSDREPTGKIYFVGKLLWAKGFEIMLDLQDYYKECTGEYFPIDIYGNGPDEKEIMRAFLGRRSDDKKSEEKETAAQDAEILHGSVQIPENISNGAFSLVESLHVQARERLTRIKKRIKVSTESLEIDLPRTLYELRRNAIPATFPGRVDHALLKEEYSIFVNPSVSEVLCTTTAEALAMNKWVIIPVHPSNTFFTQFPNCLSYSNKFEFAANLRWAMTHEPEPLSEELAHRFTWEAATERFIAASAITYKEARERDRKGVSKLDQRIAWFHNELGKGKRGDAVRKLLGGGPVSDQVKYQQILADGDGDEEDSNEGLSIKFFGSSLAKALESTLSKGLPSLLSKTSTG